MDVKPGSSSGLQVCILVSATLWLSAFYSPCPAPSLEVLQSSILQHAALLPPPTRSKRCATHCYIAQFIQHQQRVAKMNSFWPPAAAAAAAAAANRSGPFFGARPFGMGVVPPTDAASMLVNPMQGSYPVRAHTPMQEAKAPSIATSPFQGSLSKDKALGNAAGAESSQRKQPPAHETQQSTPMPNMLVRACWKSYYPFLVIDNFSWIFFLTRCFLPFAASPSIHLSIQSATCYGGSCKCCQSSRGCKIIWSKQCNAAICQCSHFGSKPWCRGHEPELCQLAAG